MSTTYFASLDFESRKRYQNKLRIDGETLSDPYSIPEDEWIDDVSQWPTLEFGDIYTYLIDTPGTFTKEALKAYKSLEAYNYYRSGYVRTVFYCKRVSKLAVMKAKVNPSQKDPNKHQETWIIVCKKTGTIKAAHCTYMAG